MAPRAVLALAALLGLLHGAEAAVERGGRGESGGCNVTQLSSQLEGALSTYDREWPPAAPAHVAVSLTVRHATIDDGAATVRLLADLTMSWEDKRLGWNSSDSDCDSALVSGERLWRPDVVPLSATARDVGDAPRARVSAAGQVRLVARLDLDTPIALDLGAWPRDQHRVVFMFGSRTHFKDEIYLTLGALEPVIAFESGSWELMSVDTSITEWTRAGVESRAAEFAVTLRRRAAAHVLAAASVLAAAALLLVAAALLPPAARAPLCAAASFTAALWLAAAVSRVGSAATAPRSLAALGALCACGGAAAAAAAATLRVARCTLPPPRALRTLLTNSALLRTLTPLQVQGGEESSAWAAAAQLLDALCVLALLLGAPLGALLGALL